MRTLIYVRHSTGDNGTEAELLRQSVEDRGDTVIASFSDDPAISGKNKYAGWRAMMANLEHADRVVIGSMGHLPGRTVQNLLAILSILRDHCVSLRINREGIDTCDGSSATLDLIAAYRRVKLSEAIRAGQARARTQGKVIGRPSVPDFVRQKIQIALQNGSGIRPTARLFKVSGGTVVNIRSSSTDTATVLAA